MLENGRGSELTEYIDQALSESTVKATLGQAKQDCKEIGDKLSGFEDAWHIIRLASIQLLQNVELAHNLTVRSGDLPLAD